MNIPQLLLLELRFRTTAPVRKLPRFHGPQWSALFRYTLKPFLSGVSLGQIGASVQAIETGATSYKAGEPIHVGLSFPAKYRSEFNQMLAGFNKLSTPGGHFQPGITVRLEEILCRISGEVRSPENCPVLSHEFIAGEAEKLSQLEEFTLHFYSPLRLARPPGCKRKGHKYCDGEFFFEDACSPEEHSLPVNHLISRLRYCGGASGNSDSLLVTGGTLRWTDMQYGRDFKKTIGGVVGKIKVSGRPDSRTAMRLAAGQYTGAGKNAAFGLGFYLIPELNNVRCITSFSKGIKMLQRDRDGTGIATGKKWQPVFDEHWRSGVPVYLTSLCSKAYSRGPELVIQQENGETEKLLWNRISRLIIVGRSRISGGTVYRALRENIPVTYITLTGRVLGRVHPENYAMPKLTQLQQAAVDNEALCLELARELVSAKIHNCMVILRRNGIGTAKLKTFAEKAKKAKNLETLRGCEGAAAKAYFKKFAALTAPLPFKARVYHPPEGPVNAMLSFGYSLLYNRLAVALEEGGFDPRLGFFHQGRGMHAALASDLLEELRHLADRVTLSLIHRHEISEANFSIDQQKGRKVCHLEGEGFRKYIHKFETTMSENHSYSTTGRMSYNAYLDEIAGSLKRSLKRGIPYKALRIR